MDRHKLEQSAPMPVRIRGDRLDAAQPWVGFFTGCILIGLSFAGTMATLNGGWKLPVYPLGLVAGFALQAACTLIQWMYRRRRLSFQWLAAVNVGIIFSIQGYAEVLQEPLAVMVARLGASGRAADGLVWLVIFTLASAIEIVPETVLIDG